MTTNNTNAVLREEEVDLTFDLEALVEVRKTLSITMTKLEAKLLSTNPNSRIHTEASRTYAALRRAYDEVASAISDAAGVPSDN